jgi:hypothetical protein
MQHVAGYFRAIYLTFRHPSQLSRWHPAPMRLLVFLVPNVLAGTALFYYFTDSDDWSGVPLAIASRFVMWLVLAIVLFGLSRLMDGHGTFFDTFALTLHVAGTSFLLAMIAMVLLAGALRLDLLLWHVAPVADLSKGLTQDPVSMFLIVSLLLGSTILPAALGSLHEFRWPGKSLLAVPSIVLLVGWINFVVSAVQAQR